MFQKFTIIPYRILCDEIPLMNLSFQNIEYMNAESTGSNIGKKGTPGLIDAVFRMLKRHSRDRRDIVVRLTFCLGNLVSTNNYD